MKRTGNEVTLIHDKGRGLYHPEKIMVRRHAAPTRHLPVSRDGKQGECIEALESLDVSLDSRRDEAASILRANGYQFRNEVLGPALEARHSSPV